MAGTIEQNIRINVEAGKDDLKNITQQIKQLTMEIYTMSQNFNNVDTSDFIEKSQQLGDSLARTLQQFGGAEGALEAYKSGTIDAVEALSMLNAVLDASNPSLDRYSTYLDGIVEAANASSKLMDIPVDNENVENINKEAESLLKLSEAEQIYLSTLNSGNANETKIVHQETTDDINKQVGAVENLATEFEQWAGMTDWVVESDKQLTNSTEQLTNAEKQLSTESQHVQDALKGVGDASNINSNNLGDVSDNLENTGDSAKDFNINGEQLTKTLGSIMSQGKLSAQSIGSLATALGASAGGVALAVGALNLYKKACDEAVSSLKEIGGGLADAATDGVDLFNSAITSMVDIVDEAIDKLQELADVGAEIETDFFNLYTILGEDAGNEISKFTDKLEELYNIDSHGLIGDMQSIIAAAGSIGGSSDDLVRFTENMTMMAEDLSMIAGSFDKASSDIGNAISKGFIGRSSSLYVLLTKEEKDTLKDLDSELERYNYLMSMSDRIKGRYLDYLDTEAGKVMQLKNAYNALMGRVAEVALKLYSLIAPVLTKILNLASRVLDTLMGIFNINVTTSVGKDTTGSIASDITKDLEKLGKTADEVKRKVAAFDDVIQINKDSKSGSDLLDASDWGKDFDYGWLEDFGDAADEARTKWDDFLEALKNKEWYNAGWLLADALADSLEKIPWDKIKQGAHDAAEGLAEFFNGFNANKRFWTDIGSTFAEGFNTIFTFLDTFAKTFNFRDFGDSLATAWNSFWDTFDTKTAGDALYGWIKGAFELAYGFFENDPISHAGAAIANIIETSVGNITKTDLDNLAKLVANVLDDVFTGAGEIVGAVADNADGILGVLTTMLDSAIEWINGAGKDKLSDIGDDIVSIIKKVIDSGVINKIWTALGDAYDNANMDEVIEAWTEAKVTWWLNRTAFYIKNGGAVLKGAWDAIVDGADTDLKNQAYNDVINNLKKELDNGKINYDEYVNSVRNAQETILGVTGNFATTFAETKQQIVNDFNNGIINEEQFRQAFQMAAEYYGYSVEQFQNEIENTVIEFKPYIEVPSDLITVDEDKVTSELDQLQQDVNEKLAAIGKEPVDLTKAVNVAELEQRVASARSEVEKLSTLVQNLKDSSGTLSGIIQELKDSGQVNDELVEFLGVIETNLQSALEAWSLIITTAIDNIDIAYQGMLDEITTSVTGITTQNDTLYTNMNDNLNNCAYVVNQYATAIHDAFESIKLGDVGLNIMKDLLDGMKKGWSDIRQWWNTSVARSQTYSFGNSTRSINIPRLATGGIVSRSTLANIGENGAEAVVPLEKNTAWMDKLAGSLVDKMKSGGTSVGGNVTIDMSAYSKNFYTRSEMMEFAEHVVEALKVYGVNISVAY